LPHQRLQWNINGQRRGLLHQWSTTLWVAKHDDGARAQYESGLCRGGGMIQLSEDDPSLCFDSPLKSLDGFLHRIFAWFGYQARCGVYIHVGSLLFSIVGRSGNDAPESKMPNND
jgi:hypothetical protein